MMNFLCSMKLVLELQLQVDAVVAGLQQVVDGIKNNADSNLAGLPGNYAWLQQPPGFVLLIGTDSRGKKLLTTVVAAEVELLPIAFGMNSGCFVNGHPADRVFGHGFRYIHGKAPLLEVVTVF